ncbi:MAG TPA: thiamine pyrophosphate-dependent enzyme, partial [Geminicoccaceae bacterium]|nr:thiamine pyrophosphate-dependent enzyme [Geminicoccaceae bacterium]
YDAAERLRVIATRHEQAAGYMAYGYAAASGRPGAYCVVPGPGFLNTTAALATAYACNTPVLCLSGQVPLGRIGRGFGLLHELPDQLGIMQRLTKWAARIEAPQDAPRLIAEAFAHMRTGRPRPVALEIPMDVLAQEAWLGPERPHPSALAHPEPDPEALERAAALLNRAERPMIFVGGGAQDASAQVRALAERLGAPVVAGWMGRGVMDDRSPLSLSLTMAHRLWPEVDVALAIGSRFQRVQTEWGLDENVKVIRIDLDPVEITRHARPEVALLADAAEALDALLPLVRSDDRRAWRERIAATKEEVSALYRRELAPQVAFLDAIRAALPEDGILVEDLTQVGYVARIVFPTYGPRQYISSGYQGTLGHAFPSALGVKVARPDRAVVALAGDGGFMYNVQELSTAVQHGIAIVALVFNDGAYGNVKRMQREFYGNRVIASDLVNPDFVRLADSFGVFGRAVTDPDGLRDALEQALALNAPALIEVKVGEFPAPWQHIVLPRVRGRSG